MYQVKQRVREEGRWICPHPPKKWDAVLKCWQSLGPYPAFDKERKMPPLASINETILYNSL